MLDDVRRSSKGAFNAPHRLEIAAAVHRLGRPTFTTGELLAALESSIDNDNNVSRNLKKLTEADLVEDLGPLWRRHDSVFWRLCEAWYRELLEVASDGAA